MMTPGPHSNIIGFVNELMLVDLAANIEREIEE